MSVCLEQKKYQNNVTSQNHVTLQNTLEREYPSLFIKFSSMLWVCIKQISVWRAKSRQRNDLEKLDARLLDDIGYTPMQVRTEVKKPFWK